MVTFGPKITRKACGPESGHYVLDTKKDVCDIFERKQMSFGARRGPEGLWSVMITFGPKITRKAFGLESWHYVLDTQKECLGQI